MLFAVMGFLALSCQSVKRQENVVRPAGGYSISDMSDMAQKNPERAIALAFESISEGKNADDNNLVSQNAREEMDRRFAARIAKGEWFEALVLYRSIVVASKTGTMPAGASAAWNEAAIMEALADSLSSSGDPGRALLWYERAFAMREPERASMEKAWKLAIDSGNSSAQRVLLPLARKMGAASAAEVKTLEGAKPEFKEMIKGVCTIWVNKGLKVESGVAVPDRVIGSGFFIDKRGYLLTNYHVISSEVDPEYEGYSRLFIRLSGMKDERIPATVIGWDKNLDLALLKASVTPEFVFSVSPGRTFSPGDRIYAIGSPVGLENTITAGIVSATGREVFSLGDALQVDVAVNPGNSGGPLLDENGELAGIIFAGLLDFQGLNFAIPANWVVAALDRLYAGGEVGYAFAGISLLPDGEEIKIVYPLYGSPAREFGVRSGDTLVSIDGKTFPDFISASAYILSRDPGSLVMLELEREGKAISVLLPLSRRPFRPMETAFGKDPKERLFAPIFGMDIELTSKDIFSANYRIIKIYKGKIADEAGFSENDPFTLQGWKYDKENKAVVLSLYVKRRKQGFLETIIQIAAPVEGIPFL
jgi:serine protease Do